MKKTVQQKREQRALADNVFRSAIEAYDASVGVRDETLRNALLQEIIRSEYLPGYVAMLCDRVLYLESRIAALEQQREVAE